MPTVLLFVMLERRAPVKDHLLRRAVRNEVETEEVKQGGW